MCVFLDDRFLTTDISLLSFLSGSELILLSGQISKSGLPLGKFLSFPSSISFSSGTDLFSKSSKKLSDLVEESLVGRAGSDLGEGVNKWGVSGEFVIKVGHGLEFLGNLINSSFKLDEKSTSLKGFDEGNSLSAGIDSIGVLLVKSFPSSVFTISLGLTSFDLSFNISKFSHSSSKHSFGFLQESFGCFDSGIGCSGGFVSSSNFTFVHGDLVLADSSFVLMGRESISGLSVEFSDEFINHSYYVFEVIFTRGHVDGDLCENGLSEWMVIYL